jgi:membrane-bound lytic murein transglycosylase D
VKRYFIVAVFGFLFLGIAGASDLLESAPFLGAQAVHEEGGGYDRALRQKKTLLPPRLAQQQLDRQRGEVLPTIAGLDKELTQYFVERYSNPAGLKWLVETLNKGAPYLAFIREEIAARDMPPELLYLPVIESGFVAKARSSSGAAGFWQFMKNSIKPYMTINEWVDERLDFWRATHAALSKLQNNYNDYDDWALALAAYNSGSGAISKTLKQTGVHDYWLLADKKKLKSESIYYVPKLIAIYYIVSNPRKFGLDILTPADEHRWTRVPIDKQINLSMLADYAGLDSDELRLANVDLTHNLTPPNGYLLKVKHEQAAAVKEVLARDDLALLKYYTHTIKSGDTLSAIALHFGVSVEQIEKQNPGLRARYLKIGEVIAIPALKDVGPYTGSNLATAEEKGGAPPLGGTGFPQDGMPPLPPTPPSGALPRNAPVDQNNTRSSWTSVWIVQKGDTLWSIARAHGIKPDLLASENGIAMNATMSIGQKLLVP